MKQKMKKGFTLVEIMIVVAIIAILAAVAIPDFLKYRADARSQACVSNMKQLQTAAESWRTTGNHATEVPTIENLVSTASDAYIRKNASDFVCPEVEGGAYTIETADGGAIVVKCPNATAHTDHVLKQ